MLPGASGDQDIRTARPVLANVSDQYMQMGNKLAALSPAALAAAHKHTTVQDAFDASRQSVGLRSLSTVLPDDAAASSSSDGESSQPSSPQQQHQLKRGRSTPLESESEGDDWQFAAVSVAASPLQGDDYTDDLRSLGAASDYEDLDDLDIAGCAVMQTCTNCTAPRFGSTCRDCGHAAADDVALLLEPPQQQACVPPAALASDLPVIAWDDVMLLHEDSAPMPHPERPDRLRAVIARLTASGVGASCQRVAAREASLQELEAVHTAAHIAAMQNSAAQLAATAFRTEEDSADATAAPAASPSRSPCQELQHKQELQQQQSAAAAASGLRLTPDCYINQHTYKCARLAAGTAAEVARLVAQGRAPCGAAIVRPPGHHAESGVAMGFCFFNNAAVAARAAQQAGARRVLILDWDVHHGNGTQHIYEADPSVLFMSLHRHDCGTFYPGTGSVREVGSGAGEGYTVNVPWNGPAGDGDYLAAFQQLLLPIAREYSPDLILVSAGMDAAEGDPIGGCHLTPPVYGHLTAMLMAVAPVVMVLEGGYNLRSTAEATEACVRVLLGQAPPALPPHTRPSYSGWLAIETAKAVHAKYWRVVRCSGSSPAKASPCSSPAAAAAAASASPRQLQPSPLQHASPRRQQQRPSPIASRSPIQAALRGSRKALKGRSAGTPAVGVPSLERLRRTAVNRKQQLLSAIRRAALEAVWRRNRRKHTAVAQTEAHR